MSALWLFNNMLNAYMFAMHGGWHFVSTLVKTWQEKLTVGAQRALRLRAISRSCGEWGPEGHTWPRCALYSSCLEIFKGFSRTTKHPNMQLFIGSKREMWNAGSISAIGRVVLEVFAEVVGKMLERNDYDQWCVDLPWHSINSYL